MDVNVKELSRRETQSEIVDADDEDDETDGEPGMNYYFSSS